MSSLVQYGIIHIYHIVILLFVLKKQQPKLQDGSEKEALADLTIEGVFSLLGIHHQFSCPNTTVLQKSEVSYMLMTMEKGTLNSHEPLQK